MPFDEHVSVMQGFIPGAINFYSGWRIYQE